MQRKTQTAGVQLRTTIAVSSCKSNYQIWVSVAQMQRPSPDSTHGHEEQAQHTHLDEFTVMQTVTLTH